MSLHVSSSSCHGANHSLLPIATMQRHRQMLHHGHLTRSFVTGLIMIKLDADYLERSQVSKEVG